jgi:hypothetical protein
VGRSFVILWVLSLSACGGCGVIPQPDAGPDIDGGPLVYPDGGCTGLSCQHAVCPAGSPTTVWGHVYDPSGKVPLYNAIVYVPNGPLEPFTDGLTCGACSGGVTGNPLVITLSAADGSFKLQNVPSGTNVPLVFQIGKWRRQVVLPSVAPCEINVLSNPDLQRLPRSHAEGDIPRMAISTGSADPLECLLLKMGLDASEISNPGGVGRVHMYRASGGPGVALDAKTPMDSALFLDAGALAQYDVVLLPCEGLEYPKPSTALENLVGYTTLGGRVFATHFSYVWTAYGAWPFPTTALWTPDYKKGVGAAHPPPDPSAYQMDISFPKGKAYSEWLGHVGALDGGQIWVNQSRDDVEAVNPTVGTTRWIYGENPNDPIIPSRPTVEHLSFNMPLSPPLLVDGGPGAQCGRVVFSDFHVTINALSDAGIHGADFPASCQADQPFTSQEKALLFMLFDVSACVQSDTLEPLVCPGFAEACSTQSPCCSGLFCHGPTGVDCAQGQSGCTCSPVPQ